jgi:hypothetical protein
VRPPATRRIFLGFEFDERLLGFDHVNSAESFDSRPRPRCPAGSLRRLRRVRSRSDGVHRALAERHIDPLRDLTVREEAEEETVVPAWP